jgi:hypothetical protein
LYVGARFERRHQADDGSLGDRAQVFSFEKAFSIGFMSGCRAADIAIRPLRIL